MDNYYEYLQCYKIIDLNYGFIFDNFIKPCVDQKTEFLETEKTGQH